MTAEVSLDVEAVKARWQSNRGRSRALFREILDAEAYWERPIPLRHPFVFYEGHLSAFAARMLKPTCARLQAIDPALESLFDRGVDPQDATGVPSLEWPERARIEEFVSRVDEAVEKTFEDGLADSAGKAVHTALEHEEMHQETLLYMLHRVPYSRKRKPAGTPSHELDSSPAPASRIEIPAGSATLGAPDGELPFGWDNEFPATRVDVAAFDVDARPVTNDQWLEFVEAGGYGEERWWTPEGFAWVRGEAVRQPAFWVNRDGSWFWRAQFEEVPLPGSWPVWVSHAEATAYSVWKGRRLPTEAEYHRAAFGRPDGGESGQPWGDEADGGRFGNFGAVRFDPVPVGARSAGTGAWGVEELVGNGWEWTSTPFEGFPGFRPMASYPGYSADFFDGRHFVMKGASPATPLPLVRRSFRNWFQPHYPYVYAKFRTVGR